MPFPLDVTTQETGAPYLTGPDGTTAPDSAGDAVDLTGVPITVAPEANGVQAGDAATITAFGEGLVTVGGLTGMKADMVGREMTLSGCDTDGNNGTFPIIEVSSGTTVVVENADGAFPDANSGSIVWSLAPLPTQFAPGDPLTYLADLATPFNVNQTTSAPHGGGSEELPPNTVVTDPVLEPHDEGKNDPVVTDPPGATTGPLVFTDPQNPVRTAPSASLTVNHDPTSPAFGLQPILADGPAAGVPRPNAEVPEAAVRAEVMPAGNMIYGSVSNVTFSRGP